MMFGSILYNCWAALIGFTVYFFVALQKTIVLPLNVLLGSFIAALIVFLCMFPVRMFLSYIFYTPKEIEFHQIEQLTDEQSDLPSISPHAGNKTSTVEFEDESTEEIAKVVRTMMHTEEGTMPSRS
ncbi:hypothetical protein [Lysinibacillus sp. 54212]|uniref:hypothetical protein n=1 Tax=Lysinibacillus sp. 54212 TaxID=3119829 RepID=UPI002FC7532C